MNILSTCLRRFSPGDADPAGRARPTPPSATDSASADGADLTAPTCGWFESSFELRQGLAVTEWPASDLPVAALYFAGLRRSALRSERLQ